MKIQIINKQQLKAMVLLALFMPILLVSYLHTHHQAYSAANEEYIECTNHNCGGHIGKQIEPLHKCVLCLFHSIAVVMPTSTDLTNTHYISKLSYVQLRQFALPLTLGITVPRAPPAL